MPSRNACIQRDFHKGHTQSSLAIEYGISTTRIHQIVKKMDGQEEHRNDLLLFDNALSAIELDVRQANCLQKAGIKSIEELIAYSEADLIKIKNLGIVSIRDLKRKLMSLNHNFRRE